MSDDCPCPRCQDNASDDERALHRAIRGLRGYVERPRWPFFCAQLDQRALFGQVDDALLAQICEVAPDQIAEQRGIEDGFNTAREARLRLLAADDETFELLRHYWRHRLDWRRELALPAAGHCELRLTSNGKLLQLRVPDHLESFLVLFEIFLAEPYRDLPPVARIYDLGAHIGLAALYLHARQPHAELICVEPVAASAELIEQNLERNGVPGQVLRCAVGATAGAIDLQVCAAAPSLSAQRAMRDLAGRPLGALATTPTRVPCRRFDEVISGADYGIKTDVEGAEHGLLDSPQVVTGARWLAGEVHLGPAIAPVERSRELLRLLAQHGLLELDGPGVFGDSVTYAFRCLRPMRLFAR